MPRFARRAPLTVATLPLFVALTSLSAHGAAKDPSRWTAATPEALITRARDAAIKGGVDSLARLVLIASLNEDAGARSARAALRSVARSSSAVANDAKWLALTLEPAKQRPAWAGIGKLPYDGTAEQGLVGSFAVLGPFENTGGGLSRKEGPESAGHDFRSADYSWGVYAVRTRRTLLSSMSPRGLPLDLYVHPRKESCSYLSTVVAVAAAERLTIRVATAGAFRLRWDGHDLLKDDEVHEALSVDRAAVNVEATKGDHLLTLKVCSAARPDDGRVRVRLTDASGKPAALQTSSELARLQRVLERSRKRTTAPTSSPGRTSLAKALALGPEPSPRRALAAALLRTLGGAEDTQSLKSPGLLDRVMDSPDRNTDQLLMCGYVTPFSANRSGWLQQALELAKSSGDDAAQALAQRALTLARLRAGLGDLAETSVHAPPLSKAQDAHAKWLRAYVKERLSGSGLKQAALDEMLAIAGAQGGNTPVSVWRAIARLSRRGRPRTYLGALQRLTEQLPEVAGQQFVAAHRFMGAESMEKVAMPLLLQQHHANEVIRIAQLLLKAGRYRAAREAFELATLLAPNRSAAHRGLARSLQATTSVAHNARIIEALERARELDPRDASIGAELAFRKGEQKDTDKLGQDAAHIVAPAVFLKRAKDNPAKKGLFERQLHWRRVVRFHGDKRVSQMMHYAREIIIEPRTENERYERIPRSGRGTQLLLARLHRPDGSVVPPEEQESTGAMVRWPKLKRGDVVEIAIRTWTPGPVGRRGDPPFYFIDYVGSVDTHPVLHNEVVFDAPLGAPLAFDIVGGKADDTQVETRDGRRITRLVWNNPPRIADEPLAPRLSELLPVVVGSVYPKWTDFLKWYRGAIEGFTTPDDKIKRLAIELTEGKRSREDKLNVLFNYVADDIRYVNYTSGEWWLPNRPQHLLARRQGDCDDKAMLLISLLRSVGIEAHEVLVQTRYTAQQRVLMKARIAVPMFDHGIIFLPDEQGEGGRFLDATSPQSRIGPLPSMDARAVALPIRNAQGPRMLPQSSSKEHGADAQWTIEIETSGAGKLSATERHTGDSAFFLRNNLQQADARAQWVESNVLSRWLSNVQLEPTVAFDGELAKGQATLAFKGRSESLARREGKDLIVAIAPRVAITAQLAPLLKRTLPVVLPPRMAPNHHNMTVELVAPKTHRFAELPPDIEANGGAFGSASVAFTLSANKQRATIKRSLAFEASRIEVADYPAWRAWLRGIDRLLQRSIRLVPKN